MEVKGTRSHRRKRVNSNVAVNPQEAPPLEFQMTKEILQTLSSGCFSLDDFHQPVDCCNAADDTTFSHSSLLTTAAPSLPLVAATHQQRVSHRAHHHRAGKGRSSAAAPLVCLPRGAADTGSAAAAGKPILALCLQPPDEVLIPCCSFHVEGLRGRLAFPRGVS